MPLIKLYDGPWDGFSLELEMNHPIPSVHSFVMPERNEWEDQVPIVNDPDKPMVPVYVYRFIGFHMERNELHYLFAFKLPPNAEWRFGNAETSYNEESDYEGKDFKEDPEEE